jgi:outer membrane protein assembly factor BamE (lipoprotein component of BamABCDE complex)
MYRYLSVMYKILYIIFLSLIVTNCSFKKVVKHHGVPSLEKKQLSLTINKSNKNDIKKILGNPSTTSKFDYDVWIYIERKQTQSELKNLGKMKIFKNDVLVLEIDDYGILKKKEFFTKDDMKDLKIVEATTKTGFQRNSFIYDFMSSMRQKINDPLGQRAKKRKEITQR